jgi:thioredoxin reductase
MSSRYEAVVVGGGVAGMSAALVLGRARRQTLLLDLDGQSNRAAGHVGGLLGHDGTRPHDLYALARDQLGVYPAIEIRHAEAVDARPDGDGFVVTLGDGGEVETSVVVLATGMDYEVPDIPGFAELWGESVFHCPFCHGWDVRDKKLAVFAEGEKGEMFGKLLLGWSDDVTVVEPSEVTAARVEDGRLWALVRNDGSEVSCEAVLVHAPMTRRGTLPESLGLALTELGFVQVDGFARTSVPGVYAAGDLAVAPQQVAIAQGSGHLAGLVATRELLLGRDG